MSVDDALRAADHLPPPAEGLADLLADFGLRWAIVGLPDGGYEAVLRSTEPVRARTVAEMRERLLAEQAWRQREM
jgi:hypothetical protein